MHDRNREAVQAGLVTEQDILPAGRRRGVDKDGRHRSGVTCGKQSVEDVLAGALRRQTEGERDAGVGCIGA
jgi:hypothetical protein